MKVCWILHRFLKNQLTILLFCREDEMLGAVGFDYPEPGGPGGGGERTFVNSLSQENFPTLGNQPPATTSQSRVTTTTTTTTTTTKPFGDADFPTLGNNAKPHSMIVSTNRSGTFREADFPKLGGGGPSFRAPEVTITRSRPQQRTLEDFPALGEPSTSGASTLRFSVKYSHLF